MVLDYLVHQSCQSNRIYFVARVDCRARRCYCNDIMIDGLLSESDSSHGKRIDSVYRD